jgi:hypothetical protein
VLFTCKDFIVMLVNLSLLIFYELMYV